MTDYYKILEVNKTATDNEIKKSYRKLAMKWHPDKHTSNKDIAAEKFKTIAEAYEILSDPTKRRKYDAGSTDYLNGTHIDPHDIFKHFFGNNNPIESIFRNNIECMSMPMNMHATNVQVFNVSNGCGSQKQVSTETIIMNGRKHIKRTTRFPGGKVDIQQYSIPIHCNSDNLFFMN